jgi:iron complex transport system substrate-binding protein
MIRRALPRRCVVAVACLLAAASARAEARALPKVATLVPCVLEGLRGTPAESAVVAAARRFSYEPTPAGVADLGISHSPDFERLAASGADLIVADKRWHALAAERGRALGAEVFWFEADGVESTLRDFARLAERLQIEPELDEAIERVRRDLGSQRFRGSPRLLAVFGAPGSYLVITRRTWIGDLARTLGATLIEPEKGAESMPGYVALSEEFLAGAPIDAVLLLAHGEPQGVAAGFAADWARLRGASSSVPLVILDPHLFAINPGLRLPEAARQLTAAVTEAVREPTREAVDTRR